MCLELFTAVCCLLCRPYRELTGPVAHPGDPGVGASFLLEVGHRGFQILSMPRGEDCDQCKTEVTTWSNSARFSSVSVMESCAICASSTAAAYAERSSIESREGRCQLRQFVSLSEQAPSPLGLSQRQLLFRIKPHNLKCRRMSVASAEGMPSKGLSAMRTAKSSLFSTRMKF